MPMGEYTKEDIIKLCDDGVVHFSEWDDRDTPSAQSQLATARAYLIAGCPFRMCIKGSIRSDDETVWIEIKHYKFEDEPSFHTYYIPTRKRLDESKEKDWY